MNSEAYMMLERYLRRLGMHAPADATQQFQVTLMRQWIAHLDEVLDANHVPGQLRITIIREFLYGAMPTIAEAGVREEMHAEMAQILKERPLIPPDLRQGAT